MYFATTEVILRREDSVMFRQTVVWFRQVWHKLWFHKIQVKKKPFFHQGWYKTCTQKANSVHSFVWIVSELPPYTWSEIPGCWTDVSNRRLRLSSVEAGVCEPIG